MSEPYIAEIKIFAGNFAPRNYAFCDGQLLPISQNTALFSLIGTTYGGDGRTTTALPNLQDRVPMHAGSGPGLTTRRIGQRGGANTHTLILNEMPSHNHAFNGSDEETEEDGTTQVSNALTGVTDSSSNIYRNSGTATSMAAAAIPNVGGGAAHNNDQPYQVLSYIIALVGEYPSRS